LYAVIAFGLETKRAATPNKKIATTDDDCAAAVEQRQREERDRVEELIERG
jgi:hypothetical protein